ncbi:hypothetical protein [Streptomyces sp. NPDC004232]|uniref:hypothetical protein n=1 Tax=unclassified Streptomyces TaxID=2593676 RepID=UPI0033B9C56B
MTDNLVSAVTTVTGRPAPPRPGRRALRLPGTFDAAQLPACEVLTPGGNCDDRLPFGAEESA